MPKTIIVELGTKHFQEANAAVRAALEAADTVCIVEAYAQRYLGCTLPAGKRLEIHGTPGNDLACYMDGGEVEVFGSAQDQTANTMNAGTVVVHGRVGDAAGYAMRGDAGNFLGEYMAGGTIVLMGRAGDHLASGMHGGVIYLRRNNAPAVVPDGLDVGELTDDDSATLGALLARYDACFGTEPHEQASVDEFVALRPASSRPYAAMYAS